MRASVVQTSIRPSWPRPRFPAMLGAPWTGCQRSWLNRASLLLTWRTPSTPVPMFLVALVASGTPRHTSKARAGMPVREVWVQPLPSSAHRHSFPSVSSRLSAQVPTTRTPRTRRPPGLRPASQLQPAPLPLSACRTPSVSAQ